MGGAEILLPEFMPAQLYVFPHAAVDMRTDDATVTMRFTTNALSFYYGNDESKLGMRFITLSRRRISEQRVSAVNDVLSDTNRPMPEYYQRPEQINFTVGEGGRVALFFSGIEAEHITTYTTAPRTSISVEKWSDGAPGFTRHGDIRVLGGESFEAVRFSERTSIAAQGRPTIDIYSALVPIVVNTDSLEHH